MFADADVHGAFSGVVNYSDDDLNWLYPMLPNVKVFVCPSTENNVRQTNTSAITPFQVSPFSTFNQSGVTSYGERIHGDSSYLVDLVNNAAGKKGTTGHSYEVAGFLNGSGIATRKTQKTIASYSAKLTQAPYISAGAPLIASDIWILYDADDKDSTDPSRQHEDYPDSGDNHGTDGGNVVFCDGHAQWIGQKNYLRSWALGTDELHGPVP